MLSRLVGWTLVAMIVAGPILGVWAIVVLTRMRRRQEALHLMLEMWSATLPEDIRERMHQLVNGEVTERQVLVDQLVAHEGLRLRVYDDATGKDLRAGDTLVGNPTIGIGRNLSGKGISSREAFELCDHDVDEVVADLTGEFPWFVKLDGHRQRAVVDLRFNLGVDGFRTFKKFIHAMAVSNYAVASAELIRSRWARQVQPDRRNRIVTMIETGVDPCAES